MSFPNRPPTPEDPWARPRAPPESKWSADWARPTSSSSAKRREKRPPSTASSRGGGRPIKPKDDFAFQLQYTDLMAKLAAGATRGTGDMRGDDLEMRAAISETIRERFTDVETVAKIRHDAMRRLGRCA